MLEAIFFVLCRFRRQRFGLFCACGFVAFWGSVLVRFGLGFRWRLAIAACRFAMLEAIFLGSVGNVSALFTLANGAFLAVLGPDSGGVRPFWRHCRRVPFCVCSG